MDKRGAFLFMFFLSLGCCSQTILTLDANCYRGGDCLEERDAALSDLDLTHRHLTIDVKDLPFSERKTSIHFMTFKTVCPIY